MKLTIEEIQAIETEMVKEVVEICEGNNITYFLHCGSALGAVRHQGPIPWDYDVDIVVPYNQIKRFINVARKELSRKYYLDYYDNNKLYPFLFPRIGLSGYSTHTLHVDIFNLVGISDNKNEQIVYTRKARILNFIFEYKLDTKKYSGQFSPRRRRYIYLFKLFSLPIRRSILIKLFEEHCTKYPYDTAVYVTNPSGHYGLKNVVKKSLYGKGTKVKYSGFTVKIPEHYNAYLSHYYGDYMQLPPIEKRNIKQIYLIGEL